VVIETLALALMGVGLGEAKVADVAWGKTVRTISHETAYYCGMPTQQL